MVMATNTRSFIGCSSSMKNSPKLKLHQNCHVDTIFGLAQIRKPGCSRGQNYGGTKRSGVSARRRNSPRTGKIRHVGVAMVEFPAKGDVLAGHVVEGRRSIPRLVGVAGILREVRRSGSRGCAIDGRQEHEVAARIIYGAAAQRQPVQILLKPEPVVEHESQKTLLHAGFAVARAVHTSPALTTSIDGHRKC